MSVINHVSLRVSEFIRSRNFYREALATLGIQMLAEYEFGGEHHAGFGNDGQASLWIGDGRQVKGEAHVAFNARSRAEVVAFYTVALSMGGRDNGPPGLRPHYHPDYFAAFVLDPDGYNIEAVHVGPELEPAP